MITSGLAPKPNRFVDDHPAHANRRTLILSAPFSACARSKAACKRSHVSAPPPNALSTSSHFRGDPGLVIDQAIQSLARHAESFRRPGNSKTQGLDTIGADRLAGMRRVFHAVQSLFLKAQ